MVAKGKDVSRHILGEQGLPKYVHHSEFNRPQNPRDYLDGIDELLADSSPPSGKNEARLFKAMHYCASRAWEARGARVTVTAPAARWIARREEIREHLIVVNLGLSYEMLRRTRFTNVDEDELLSEGLRALCDAVEAFDPWRGYRFSTYACNAVYRGFLRLSKMETRRARFITYGYDPKLDCGGPALTNMDWDERAYRERLGRAVRSDFSDLTSEERYVLKQRFPFEAGRKRATLERLGKEMAISKERVRQMQVSALEKLHSSLTAEPVLS